MNDALESMIEKAIRDCVGGALEPIPMNAPLDSIPGFDSQALYQLIDELEARLGIEFPPALILPETFDTIHSLAAALRAYRLGMGRGAAF